MNIATEDVTAAVTDTARLEALYSADLINTPSENAFNRITDLVCRFMDVPVSLVSLVDLDHQFFKSQKGLPKPAANVRRTPLSHSICKFVVAKKSVIAIEDAFSNAMTCDNLAVRDLNVMAYLGAPLISQGQVIGSLCAIDTKPRQWSQDEVGLLEHMAHFVMIEIALREKIAGKRILQNLPE